jgi:uncharacterized membrane protein
MKKIIKHLKTYMFRGLIAVIPLALTYIALRLLYQLIDKRFMTLIKSVIGISFPGMGLLLVLITLYLLGMIASNMVGKRLLSLLEKLTNYLPQVKTTYKVGKQLAGTLNFDKDHGFRKAVLVEYLKPGMWTLGFVTGVIIDKADNDARLYKVFVPTPPNPASGTMIIVKESQTRDPGWSIEDALKAVMTGGLIGPGEIN